MEGFSFVTPVTGLNRPNTGKEDDDDDYDDDETEALMQSSHNRSEILGYNGGEVSMLFVYVVMSCAVGGRNQRFGELTVFVLTSVHVTSKNPED
jgi:hypothetical protein